MAPKDKKRNYAKEAKWQATPEQIARRSERNKARRAAEKRYGKDALKGKEVHHVNAPRRGSLEGVKTQVTTFKKNRSIQPDRP